MLDPKEALALTGHAVGGVCPFGLARPLPAYCDVSIRAFDSVFPAAGSRTSSVKGAPGRLAALVLGRRVDVYRVPD